MEPATWQEQIAVLALDIRGHGRSIEDINPGDSEYMYIGITGKPENYIYVGAYLDCVRGIDFLCSRPEVDRTRVGIEGGSQGGGLSLSASGLDPRIAACTADVPWLCDWPDYAVTAPWAIENFPKLIGANKGLTQERVLEMATELIYFFLGYRRESAAHDGLHLIEGVSVSGKHFIINAANAEHDSDDPFW